MFCGSEIYSDICKAKWLHYMQCYSVFFINYLKNIIMSTIKKSPEVLTWVFFGSQGITDNADLMRCMILCQDICRLENPTVEKIKDMGGYRSCLYDIPNHLISDENLQKIIDWKL